MLVESVNQDSVSILKYYIYVSGSFSSFSLPGKTMCTQLCMQQEHTLLS